MMATINKYLIVTIIILAVGVPTAYAITITLDADPVNILGILDMMGNRITNVGTTTVSTDAATRVSVDSAPWNSRVPQSTILTMVDSTDEIGPWTSMTIGTDGLPVISYGDATNSDLKVVHCTNASCSTFDTPTILDSGDVGPYTSITIGTDGFPIISYSDEVNSDLNVVHCTNTSCSEFDTPTTLDSGGTVGAWPSITIGTDGFPVISYDDNQNGNLKVAHCENASCSSGSPTITIVDSAGDVGAYTSITIGTDGFPIISYEDDGSGELKIAHCLNVSCSGGVGVGFDTPTVVDSAGNVGQYTSITIGTDGFPIVSYWTIGLGDLKVAHCENASCSSGSPTITTVDFSGNVGQYTSITIGTDGFPVISYLGNGDLKVVHCTNPSCSTFDTPRTVDSTGTVGEWTSITIGTDGLPLISYYDFTNQELKVAKCTNPYCINNWIRR